MGYGIKTPYNGYVYDSIAEANYAKYLDFLLSKGKIKWWKRQVWFSVRAPDREYEIRPDFLVGFENTAEIHEVKNGLYTPEFLYKYQLLLAQHPDIHCFIIEPDQGRWSKTLLKEFLKPHNQTQDTPQKEYKWWQIKLSEMFYKMASKIV